MMPDLSRWQLLASMLPVIGSVVALAAFYGPRVGKFVGILFVVLFIEGALLTTMADRGRRRQARLEHVAEESQALFGDAQFVGWVTAGVIACATVYFYSC